MPAKRKGGARATTSSRTKAGRPRAPRARRTEPTPEPEPMRAPSASPFVPGMAPECMMCPFGLFFFTMRNTRPEVMEHLTLAGHELFLAFKALVDQTAERWEQSGGLLRISVR